jgi:hypothetical protein
MAVRRDSNSGFELFEKAGTPTSSAGKGLPVATRPISAKLIWRALWTMIYLASYQHQSGVSDFASLRVFLVLVPNGRIERILDLRASHIADFQTAVSKGLEGLVDKTSRRQFPLPPNRTSFRNLLWRFASRSPVHQWQKCAIPRLRFE